MSDEPKIFHFSDPAEQPEEPQDSALGLPPGASAGPEEPASDEQKMPAGGLPLEPELLSEIRQSLAEEEEQSRRASTTGRLIQRITGSLKRVTGPLGRGTGPLSLGPSETIPQPPAAPVEIPDDFVSGRLEGTTVSEQPAFRVETETPDSYQQAYEESYAAVSADREEPPVESFQLEEPQLEGDEPISLLENGVIAALGKEEEEARAAENAPDWMAEIRKETVELDSQPGDAPEEPDAANVLSPTVDKRRGFTNPLRSFITGILGGEGRRKRPEEEIPDDLVTGRLNRSMNTGPLPVRPLPDISQPTDALPAAAKEAEEEPRTGTGALRALLGDSMERPEPQADRGAEQRPATGSLRNSFFADLDEYELETGQLNPDKLLQNPPDGEPSAEPFPEGRFEVFGQKQPDKPARPGKETGGLILDEPLEDLTPEEEQLLWKLREQSAPAEAVEPPPAEPPLMFTEEEIWGAPGVVELPHVIEQPWSQPVEIEPDIEPDEQEESQFQTLTDDDYAQAYLTGSLMPKHEEAAPVNLMQQALEKAQPDEFDAHSLRAIALEGVVDDGLSAAGYADLYEDEDGWEKPEPAGPFSFKTWLAKRSPTEKFLLVEGAVALLAILVAVPFFIFVIAGGRVPTAAAVQANWISPHPLPADLPYPVGLTLPGGWSFPLQKSTFIKGEWKPASAEWLEGTELRRVVALPWNPQTEAVIQTFKIGDKIQIDLSNQDKASYKIKSIDRIPTRDTSIFADLSPSLVIVLYKENSAERWVVQCQPIR